jgi:dihydrofolate reductase
MDNITLIAAVGKNGELGKDNTLIWHLKEDMKFFKENTMGKPIVMGMNTLKSLPRLLPGREHIVLTHQDVEIEGVRIYHDINDALSYIESLPKEVMVIGGASIYKEFLQYANTMLLTEIDAEAKADVYFPTFDRTEWDREVISKITNEVVPYKHVRYNRIK